MPAVISSFALLSSRVAMIVTCWFGRAGSLEPADWAVEIESNTRSAKATR